MTGTGDRAPTDNNKGDGETEKPVVQTDPWDHNMWGSRHKRRLTREYRAHRRRKLMRGLLAGSFYVFALAVVGVLLTIVG